MTTTYSSAIDQALAEAEALVQSQRYAEGEARAQQVLSNQPKNARAHALLATSSLMQQRHAEALAHVQAALRTDRVNPRYHFIAALSQAPLGQVEEAIASYRRALQYRPEFVEARANLGYVLECAGRPAEAVACYRKVLERQPYDWFCLNRLGYCERMLGRPGEAIALLQRALAVRADFAATHNELALALLQLDRKPEAIASFRRAVELEPEFLAAWCNLAKVLYLEYVVAAGGEGSDPQPVLDVFARILELDPRNVEFAYLRDCVAGVKLARPPDAYVEMFFDRFAPKFDDKLIGELHYQGPQAAREFLASWLEGRSGLRVVDLGCGTGLSGTFLRAAAASLAGVDLSAAMLEEARKRGIYDQLVHAELVEYLRGLEPGSLDLVMALEVFNYVGDLRPVLEAASKALAHGGRMVFSVELAGDADDYKLLPAARYAHSARYVSAAAEAAGLRVGESRQIIIRREANQPVAARLFALDRD